MPFTDIAVAIQISFTYFTIIYLTGLGGLFSERSGIVNIGLEGLMIIGTVTGAFGARFFTDTVGLGTRVGSDPRSAVRRAVRRDLRQHARGRDDHVPGGPHRVRGGDQPGRDRSGPVPVLRVLQRAVDAVGPGRPAPGAAGHPRAVVVTGRSRSSVRGLIADGRRRRAHGHPRVVLAVPHPVGAEAALVRREPRGDQVARGQRAAVPLPGRAALGRVRRAVGRVPGGGGDRELAGGPDAGAGVHRARRADHLELEPDPADVLRVAVRVRRRDPAAVERRARSSRCSPTSSSG